MATVRSSNSMGLFRTTIVSVVIVTTICLTLAAPCAGQGRPRVFLPEQRSLDLGRPPGIPGFQLPDLGAPPTPSVGPVELVDRQISLDEAIRIALQNAEVVRILSGVTASSSGRTIYDVASTNTSIDQAQARFDPSIQLNNVFNQFDTASVTTDPFDNTVARLFGSQTENYNLDFTLSKTNLWGGTGSLRVTTSPSITEFGLGRPLLNPIDRNTAEFRLSQPLLAGAGREANMAPIVVARINTERSFFQYKNSVQDLVRGVVDAYWSLVFAKTDLWAREQQVKQLEFALEYIEARVDKGIDSLADESQAQVALYNTRTSLLNAQSNVYQREEALRNILGIAIADGTRLVPTTPLINEQIPLDWNEILAIAEQNRPDIIELKLILEADEQQLIQTRNQAKPQLDAIAVYRWNGLEGILPSGDRFATQSGQFTDWTLGVNFSVPLGLRQTRAGVRQQELLIARDRANLNQGIHAMVYGLSVDYRNADLLYSQYELFRQTREAALTNIQLQGVRYGEGLSILLNVLQAISDWGNAVSSEAQALTQYNTQLATLERNTGTILEAHGIRFYEERFGFAGPIARREMLYPATLRPAENFERYGAGDRPSEENFDLEVPEYRNLDQRIPQLPERAIDGNEQTSRRREALPVRYLEPIERPMQRQASLGSPFDRR